MGPAMRSTMRVPTTDYRVRDIAALFGVIIAGAGMIYTAYMRGAPPSGHLAVAGFIVAAVILFFGYGGGMLMDRLGAKHPILVRRFHHPLVFIVLSVLLTGAALYGWERRESIVKGLQQTLTNLLETVDQNIKQIGQL
jgi:hypothetical protein